jgi:hypothetical protein
MVQKIEKYIKIHVLGNFGEKRIDISENLSTKINFSIIIEKKILFLKNLM